MKVDEKDLIDSILRCCAKMLKIKCMKNLS